MSNHGNASAKPCQCLTVPAYTLGPDDTPEAAEGEGWPEGTQVYGPCDSTTSNLFAPGHDAKLKSLLIRLNREGQEYHRLEGGLLVSGDARQVAANLGWERFLTPAPTPKARKATPPKEVAKPKARKVPREVMSPVLPKGTVKVGRIRYGCVVDVEASDAEALCVIYTDSKGVQQRKNVPPSAFTPAD